MLRKSSRLFSSNSADNTPPHDTLGTQARFVQTYGIATYDGLFKYVLSDDEVRPSFFHAFMPWLSIKSSKRIDDHMNPFEQFQILRDFIHNRENSDAVARLSEKSDIRVVSGGGKGNRTVPHPRATEFLKEFVNRYDEIKLAFPQPTFNGTMDFVCKLDNGEYAMVEMQVIPEDHWDRRALAYVAAFYGNQLRKGGHWKDIQKVIGINILGGGKDNLNHWRDTPNEYVRHYKFQEQLRNTESMYVNKPRFVDGIELIQYSIMNAPEGKHTTESAEQEKQDWITFFKKAHYMQEDEVKRIIKTPAVLRAFDRATLSKMPREVKALYDAEDIEYNRYSQHTQQMVEKGVQAGVQAGLLTAALGMKKLKIPTDQIVRATGLSAAEVDGINVSWGGNR
jgi:predicted transposase/invertase (TIGR01784 family)